MKVLAVTVALVALAAGWAPAFGQGAPSASLAPPADAPPAKPQAPGPFAGSTIAVPSLMSHTVYRPTDLSGFTGDKRLPTFSVGRAM